MDDVQAWLDGLPKAERKEARRLVKTQTNSAHDQELRWAEPFTVPYPEEMNDPLEMLNRNPRHVRDAQDMQACPTHGKGRMGIVQSEGKLYCMGCNAEATKRYKDKRKNDPEFIAKRRAYAKARYHAKKGQK